MNELIIGLGGCGGRSIKELRRTIAIRAKDYEYINEKGTKIDYLYIDSNDDILGASDWNVFGKSIRLDANQVIELKQGGTTPDIDVVSGYPNIESWIGDIKDSFRRRSSAGGDDEVQRTLQTMKGAGQLRRYGRVLFAMHSAAVRTTLREKIDELVTGRDNKITFRIFCTLGGGTGSGSLIDMVTLIQSLCQSKGIERSVIVYAYVAASKAESADAGSFYENEYCSLRDLNALIVRSYHPEVTGMPFNDVRDSKFDLSTAVNRVYISSDLAPGSPGLKDQVQSVTAACFDSIVYSHSYSNPDCLKAISDEDLVDVTPGEKDSRDRIVRSYRYSVLGSRRWRVPTTQIRELLNCETENRVWLSLLNGSKLPDGIDRDIRLLEGFSFAFEETETANVYKEIEDDLIAPIKELYDGMKTQNRRDANVLTDLRDKAEEIQSISRKLNADQNKKVRFINSYKKTVASIERSLLNCLDEAVSWDIKPNVWGLRDVSRYLDNLRRTVAGWLDCYVPKSTPDELDAVSKAINEYMRERELQWSKLGVLTIQLTTLDERMMEAQYEDACSLVLNAVKEYKRIIINELVKKIDDMIRSVETAVSEFIKGIESTQSGTVQLMNTLAYELHEHMEHANGQGMRDMYAYDDKNLKAVREAMAEQIDLHEESMKNYTTALKKSVGDGAYMIMCRADAKDNFVNEMRSGLLDDTMERIHDTARRVASLDSVLVGNIIERLEQMGGNVPANWEGRLGKLVEQFMKEMSVSAEIEGNDGLRQPQVSPAAAIVIGLPHGAKNTELVTWLKDKITKSRPNKYIILGGRMEFYEHHTSEEIRILYVPYWMPCRFAKVSGYVESKYQQTLEQNDRAKIYFANYDITGEDGSSKFSRPSLTKGGEPDERNIRTTELLKHLFIRVKGEKKAIVMNTSQGIEFARDVDKYDGVHYTRPYSETQIKFPGASYKNDMMKALRMAVRASSDDNLYTSMTPEEKESVYQRYTAKVDAEPEGSDDWLEARDERTLVRELLEL